MTLVLCYSGNDNLDDNNVKMPHKDRFEMFSRHLWQLTVESLGKELDRQGNLVHQEICVFDNKWTTDQDSYFQQLRDVIENCFWTIVDVRKHLDGSPALVGDNQGSGDYLHAFCEGTADAIATNAHSVLRLIIDEVSPYSVGILISLFERAVCICARLVDINAYYRLGVEAGKKCASRIIDLQKKPKKFLEFNRDTALSALESRAQIDDSEPVQLIHEICHILAANGWTGFQELPLVPSGRTVVLGML